ncbi:related to BPL1 - biotin holocarboxylase synthetase [Melanopsichium pennsylvanicum]|uniref:Related to BPL1 - biotin holocarboxylase synthetase n=2 Tax=Melanopsichium pennsylvanicum TaxID=63383 RepID=A0AAJ4XNQ4_9BASI|nr:related to BPL1-biotin holocarboxylase synthetase [Melanopsichium pennsylvanicum 4]SNX85152.1 related to BPL1 - biotin holocarboxylase synthetase [Melanopsichium pennsylvanicum]
MSDVLVYSGPGVSSSALHHTLRTLRQLLNTYDVKPVDAKTLALDPWQKGTALVVIPGGRDLPYVSELSRPYSHPSSPSSSRTGVAEVRNYVESGGNFFGICAGAYYASTHCTFEKHTDMQVDGARPGLRFFPGTCQGTVYPGFVYESDKGARIVDIDRVLHADRWRCHYNGGGAFMDAHKYVSQGVEVLAKYARTQPEELRLDIDLNGSTTIDQAQNKSRPDYAGEAAVVLSEVGKGRALLFGTHPEFTLLPTSTPVLMAENSGLQPAHDENDEQERERMLKMHEARRLEWLHELLSQRLGLRSELPQWVNTTQHPGAGEMDKATTSVVEVEEPKSQPIYLAAIGDRSSAVLDRILSKLSSEKACSAAHIEGFEKCASLKTAHMVSIKDSNDVLHLSAANEDSIAEARKLCSSANYEQYSKSIITSSTEERELSTDREVDLDSVPKYVLVCKPDLGPFSTCSTSPSASPVLLPDWNIAEYEKHLLHFRKVNLKIQQNNQIPGHWSKWRPPFDPFDPFGSSTTSSSFSEEYRFGTPMLYTQMVTSTQTMLDKNLRFLSALPVGTTFFATQQMSGRGRGGNRWISPKGCLQFSTVFRVPVSMASKTVFLQYLSGLAVVQGIRLALGDSIAAKTVAEKVRIKWPNDIYAEIPAEQNEKDNRAKTATFELSGKRYAKLGGVLVNSQFSGGDEFVLISGCGVNCLNARPTTSISDLINIHNAQMEEEKGGKEKLGQISQEKLAGAILSTFDSIWKTFLQYRGDFRPFVETYRKVWLHSDQEVTLTRDAVRRGGQVGDEGGQELEVRIVGISSDFGLLQAVPRTMNVYAKDANAWGSTEQSKVDGIIQLQPDGNSFDMLQNLVKRKI